MARKKRYGAAEIEAKLQEVEALSAKGQTQAEISKALGISVMTIHRWRKMRQQAKPQQARPQQVKATPDAPTISRREGEPASSSSRISELELENARLRKLVTDLLLEKMRLEDDQGEFRAGGGNGRPATKRSAL
jgi:putative transposase